MKRASKAQGEPSEAVKVSRFQTLPLPLHESPFVNPFGLTPYSLHTDPTHKPTCSGSEAT
jgi:hypothetical protein